MKKVLALIICIAMILSSCSFSSGTNMQATESKDSHIESSLSGEGSISTETERKEENGKDSKETSFAVTSETMELKEVEPSFRGMDDPELLSYVENNVYANLVRTLDSDEYFVENVEAIYISKEYVDESTYNSQANVYFGYTIEELFQQFQGDRYIFTLGDDGKTTVEKMETDYDNSTERIIKNVAVGGGVILLCVTVSVVTAGVGAPAVSMIFAAAAKTGTTFAISSAALGGAAATITTGYQTHDPEAAFKAGLMASSEGFKWGAISGALMGGASEAIALHGATLNGLTMNEAAAIQKESGYPLDVIKQFKSVDEYNVYKNAGLKASQVGGKSALIRNIDLNYKTTFPNGETMTNLEAMAKGYAPRYIDPTSGKELAYQLHHINQNPNGTLAILTEAEHQGNSEILNIFGKESQIDRQEFNSIRKQFWMDFAKMVG